MRQFLQPFRENKAAAICESCRDIIYAGDMAYNINGDIYCFGCVERCAFIADAANIVPAAEIHKRTNVYSGIQRKEG